MTSRLRPSGTGKRRLLHPVSNGLIAHNMSCHLQRHLPYLAGGSLPTLQ